VRARAISSI